MIRAITFIPASSGTEGLTYVERASRNRSLHVLLQDCSFKSSAASHPTSRRNFLRKAYREIISRYVSFGRIEHPLPLARSLVGYLESLSKRVDCRVEDFSGIGFYVLLQDGETFYLLTSREGRARVRTDRGFEALDCRGLGGVTELPVETARAQKELFSRDLKDFLALYKVESHGEPGGVVMPVDISLGGSGEEMDTLLEALEQPGVIEAGVTEKTVPLNLISDKMMFVRFDGLVRARALHGDAPAVQRRRWGSRRSLGVVSLTVVALALVSLASIWMSDRWSRPPDNSSSDPGVVVNDPATESDGLDTGVAAGKEGRGAEGGNAEVNENRLQFSVAWDKTYSQPVTTTPVFSGERVFFGSRDRNLYALDRNTGQRVWRHRADGGIGASPALSGNLIIAADYKGNVFALADSDGEVKWNRKLPGKVVSSPCVGDGEVVVGCYDGSAYALSLETGRVLWRVKTGGRVRGTCARAGGTYYIPSYDGKLYAVTSGKVAWRANLGSQLSSSPAVEGDRVVVGATSGRVYGVHRPTGKVAWIHQTGGAVKSFIAVSGGRAYVGSNDNSLYCLDVVSGERIWKFETAGAVLGRPAVTPNGVIFPSYDGFVYCVDAETGSEIDRFQTGEAVYSSPVVVGERAFFGNNGGKFYCLNLRGGESS